MDETWLLARIEATKTEIEAYEAAISALTVGGAHSWSLDTGQTKKSVTKSNIASLSRSLDIAYNRLAVLEAKLYGAAGQARPAW